MKTNEKTNGRKYRIIFILLMSGLLMIFIVFPAAQVNTRSSMTIKNEDTISFETVEVKPLFNNGDPAVEFRKYLHENLKYPQTGDKKVVSGRVVVGFVVNKEGKVVNARIVKAANPLLDKEVLRVISSSPVWVSGRHNGKVVNVSCIFPVNFVYK